MKIFNGFQLKIIMVIAMTIDHVGEFIPGAPLWTRYVGRLAAPIFFYLLVEGFFNTKSRKKYMERLLVGGIIMLLGSKILTYLFQRPMGIPNNIFLSMALNIALLRAIELKKKSIKKTKAILIIVALLMIIPFTEGGLFVTIMVLIFYYNRDDKNRMCILYVILSLAMVLGHGTLYNRLFVTNYQWMMVFSLLFILMYNGERGRKSKKFFYVFYPVHIWILYVLGMYISF